MYSCFLILILLNGFKLENDIVPVDGQINIEINDNDTNVVYEEFKPTHEWQTIKKEHVLPKGLHIRMNFETGQKEAKLMESPNKKENEITEVLNQNVQEEKAAPNNLFRNYEELKKQMKDMDMLIKTETELVKELISKYEKAIQREEKIAILQDLEFYVHQVDNGVYFCDIKGFEYFFKEINNTDDIQLQTHILLLLGSSIQSNPKVQIVALEQGIIQFILRALGSFSLERRHQEFYQRLLFVLSGILGNFPLAQDFFVNKYGGIDVLSKFIEENDSTKLKIKILTLIDDLIQEMVESSKNIETNQDQQYRKEKLIQILIEKKWCSNFEKILQNSKDHDSIEKVLIPMLNLIAECKDSFKQSYQTLIKLKKEYKEVSDEADGDFFAEKLILIENLLEKINFDKIEL